MSAKFESDALDWRGMFGRYVAHVVDQEGVSFLGGPVSRGLFGGQYPFTQPEWEAIDELLAEVFPRKETTR